MKRLLIPTDFSPVAHKALHYAVDIALKNQATVVMLHVQEGESVPEESFREFVGNEPGIHKLMYEMVIRTGDTVEAINRFANENKVDLIVMGTKGANNQKVADSITARVIDTVDCPVLAIPHECAVPVKIQKIAFATDYKQVKNPLALGSLTTFARIFDAEVHVLNVKNEAQKWNATDREMAEGNLEYFLESIDHFYNFADNPDLEEGIYDFVKAHHIDLLAMMPRKHLKTEKDTKGRLTENIALKTEIPLLTFHEV